MQFALFLFSYALNPLIIFLVPDGDAENFLKIYAAASIIFSLYFTIAFANQKMVDTIRYWLPILCGLMLLFVFLSDKNGLWFLYPFSLLVGDYICTQCGSDKISIFYRISLIVSALPFVFFPEYFYELIFLRSALSILFVIVLLAYTKKFYKLAISSPAKWIAITYIFYSGSLLLIPFVGGDDGRHLKLWFIGMQVGLGLTLKKLDFSVRSISEKASVLFKFLDIIVMVIPIGLLVLAFDLKLFIIYAVSLVALLQLKPDLKVAEEKN